MTSRKAEFRLFLDANPNLLHFAAHSHHLWPDVTWTAHQQAWLDASVQVDEKWERVFGELLPAARQHVARTLGLSSAGSVAFAGNTHELLVRLFSCFEARPVSILTTDGEFHSFARQSRRWEEAGAASVVRIPTEPFDTFESRFLEAASDSRHDLVFLSHVFFDSGFVFGQLEELAELTSADAYLVVDGYHGFMALPTSWRPLEERVFYIAGGYKYAMAGEGACFMHCPPGFGPRPVNTGWYAAFGDLQKPTEPGQVPYAADGSRFLGSTFDPTGLYRFVAAMDRWHQLDVSVEDIHQHVGALQGRLLDAVAAQEAGPLVTSHLRPPPEYAERAHFLTFERPDAAELHRRLRQLDVVTDVRGQRLRFGFGLYQDKSDVDALIARLQKL